MLKEPLITITIIIIIIIIITIIIIIIIIIIINITSTTVSTRAIFKWMTRAITPFAIATLVAQLCNHRKANAKPIAHCTRIFPRALSKLQVIDRNSDWFIAHVEINLSNYFAIGFSTVIYMIETFILIG